MKREEILELMNAKDAEVQADIDFNKHVFETIKQPVMDEIITYCIKNRGVSKEYTIRYDEVKSIVVDHIFEMEELPVNDDERCRLKSLHIQYDIVCGMCDDEVLFNNSDLMNYMERLELFSVCSSVSDMLGNHGFKYNGDYHRVLCSFSTTKENLLRYPEIIYKCVGDVNCVPEQHNQQVIISSKQEDDKVVLGALKFLTIVLVVIVLWIFTYLIF